MKDASEHLAHLEAIFHEVLAVDPGSRPARLKELCGDDALLLAEVAKLLRAAERERLTSGSLRSRQTIEEAAFAQRRIGPYQLQSLLGRGGTGAVYLAQRTDGQYEKKVAIKLIDVPMATEFFRDRFRRERQILAGLEHPLIARLLDGGVAEDGSPYLVMDYVSGIPIDQYCRQALLSIEQRLQLFLKVCDAVQFAHQNLVVHRDLKPDNILVSNDGIPHLLDFGTAKLLSPENTDLASHSTREGFLSFTPQYASPEQVLGQPITIRSDVYSLGVLLFLLLTGEQPYVLADFTTEEMLRVIVNLTPARPGSSAMPYGPIDADLDSIVLKALRKEPQERYPTVEQLSADVQAFLENRPVKARRGSLRYQAAKFIRRNRISLFAAVLLVLMLLAGVGGVLWQARVANLEWNRAEARSADLRELSNSLLSELDDALKEIPGTTGAQKLLVTRVLDHLDRMARDARGDRQSSLDLINAYTRLGNVQSNTYYQNLGDTPGALVSFEKALALAAPLAVSHPLDRDILRAYAATLQARGEVLSNAGDAQTSAESLKAAVRIYDRVVELPGVTSALIFEAAIAYEVLGNELGEDSGLGDPAAAAVAYHRAIDMDYLALRLDSNFMRVRRGLPMMHMHLGNLILETDPVNARSEFQTALQLFDALPTEQRQKRPQVSLRALLLRKTAAADAELSQYSLAAPLFSQALAIYRQLAESDSTNVGALADLYRVLNAQATSYEYAVDPLLADALEKEPQTRRRNLQEAASSLQQCAEIIRRILQLAPSQGGWKTALADVLLRRNSVQVALGMPSLSAHEIATSVSELRQAAEGTHASADDIRVAVPALLLPDIGPLGDPSLALQMAERGVDLTHRREANYMLLLARAQRANHQPALAGVTARRGIELLPANGSGHPEYRLFKLLEAQSN